MAEKRNTILENSLEACNAFVLDYTHMPSLREQVRLMADHWKLISFRQDFKARSPSAQNLSRVTTEEKQLRIAVKIKSQMEPIAFTVPSVQFHVEAILQRAKQGKGFETLIRNVVNNHSEVMRLVEKQKQLEFQLYIKRLISYTKTKRCPSCHTSVGISVYYTELVKSNDNGDSNLNLLLNIETDEKSNRDEHLVTFFFSLMYRLR